MGYLVVVDVVVIDVSVLCEVVIELVDGFVFDMNGGEYVVNWVML